MAVTFEKSGIHLEFLEPDKVRNIWADIAPLYERSISHSAHGEFTLDDLFDLAVAGRVAVGVARQHGEIILSLMVEDRIYPHAKSVNVFALAGRNLDGFMTSIFPLFCDWCREKGIEWIECSVSPAMARIHSRYGFKTVYQTLRFNLDDKDKK